MGRTSSVVVTYNHRAYIGACLLALEAAELPPGTRLLLVDNGSSDGTPDYVRSELLAPGDGATRGGLPATFIANPSTR